MSLLLDAEKLEEKLKKRFLENKGAISSVLGKVDGPKKLE